MQLQIPQNSASAPAQSAIEQVNPSQQFGHVLEQQSGRTAIPEAPQIFDTGAIIGRGLESLNNVVQDVAVKAKAIKSAEEHSRLQNDLIDVQMETQEARKLAAANKAELGLSNDEFEVEYSNRVKAIIEKRPLDSYSDPDIRRTAQISFKSFEANDALDFQQRVAIPARVSKIKSDLATTEQKLLTHIENDPEITAETADGYKAQFAKSYDNPAVIATLGVDAARASKAMMMAKVDKRLFDNKYETPAWKEAINAHDMNEATARVNEIATNLTALVTSRPNMTAEDQDKAKDLIAKRRDATLKDAESQIHARQRNEMIQAHLEVQNKTSEIVFRVGQDQMGAGEAVKFVADLGQRADAALADGNLPLADWYGARQLDINKALSEQTTRRSNAAARSMKENLPLANGLRAVSSGIQITDQKEVDAVTENELKLKKVQFNDPKAVVAALAPVMHVSDEMPTVVTKIVRGLMTSHDPEKQKEGYQLAASITEQYPRLANKLDEDTKTNIYYFKEGYSPASISKMDDERRKLPKEQRDKFGKSTFNTRNLMTVEKVAKSSSDAKPTPPSLTLMRERTQYHMERTGDINAATKLASVEVYGPYTGNNDVYGATSIGQAGTFGTSLWKSKVEIKNPPEKLLNGQEFRSFEKQVKNGLTGRKNPATGKEYQDGEYTIRHAPTPDNNKTWNILVDDGYGNMVNVLGRVKFDPTDTKVESDDSRKERLAKAKAKYEQGQK